VSIEQRLRADLKTAMRARDDVGKTTIRMALAALKNACVSKNADLTPDEELGVLGKEARQLKDAIVEYRRGNRQDLVEAASAQIEILERYLPQPLGEAEIRALIQAAIAETGATSPKQMGPVMRVLMPQVRGRADGGMVSQMVRTMLAEANGCGSDS
jgi:uncharacterized protein YqeY